jgi:glutathione peroxidase
MSASPSPRSIYGFTAKNIDGNEVTLDEFRGKVLLIVNVASRCLFTGQYAGLEALYQDYQGQGFEVLGFPCNQFMNQEPKDEKGIQQFCSLSYNVSFPMFSKVNVNGKDAHPLFRFLTQSSHGWLGSTSIKWNFTKFLVSRTGEVVQRYSPATSPSSIRRDIEFLLGNKSPSDSSS